MNRLERWYIRRKIAKAIGKVGMKNWKTTGAGFALAVLQLVAGGMGWKSAITAALMAMLGLAAKDHDVTGGTKSQD